MLSLLVPCCCYLLLSHLFVFLLFQMYWHYSSFLEYCRCFSVGGCLFLSWRWIAPSCRTCCDCNIAIVALACYAIVSPCIAINGLSHFIVMSLPPFIYLFCFVAPRQLVIALSSRCFFFPFVLLCFSRCLNAALFVGCIVVTYLFKIL